MENKEKLINEIHRNLQLMEVDLVNEQPKEFVRKVVNKVTGFGKTPKLNLMQKLDDVIKNNEIKKGNTIVLTAIGSGWTWGSTIIKL